MQSTFAIERTTGVIMLLIILLGAASFVGGHSTGSGEPYFTNDFPTFVRNLGNHTRQLIFQFALATTLLPAAALLYLTFRPQGRGIAAAGALALVTSSVLFFASAVAGVRLRTLAGVWSGGGTPRDSVWFAARDAIGVVEAFTIFGFLAFAASFFVFGVVIARSTPLPRGLGVLALGGAIVTNLGVGGLAVSDGDALWAVSMLGLIAVLVSFVVTGGWLAIRGTRPPAGPATS